MLPTGEGPIVSAWPRAVLVTHPAGEDILLDSSHLPAIEAWALGGEAPGALGAKLAKDGDAGVGELRRPSQGPEKGVFPAKGCACSLERLRTLDQHYAGWQPVLRQRATDLIERAEILLASRRLFVWPRVARPTLPASVARRILHLGQWDVQRVYIEDDIDALSVLLAQSVEVIAFEPQTFRRAWLAQQAAREGASLALVSEPPAEGSCDMALIHAGSPAETHAALERAVSAVRSGGHIAICVRAPGEWSLYAQLQASHLDVVAYEREVDHWLLPGGWVVDGAGDMVVVHRPLGVQLEDVSREAAERVRVQPYLTIDFDSLDEKRLDESAIERLADAIAFRAPRSEALRTIGTHGDTDVLCWYDTEGSGLTAQLDRDKEHLLVTLMPYDRELEYVCVCAAYHELADELTRTRPLRTRRSPEEMVFG